MDKLWLLGILAVANIPVYWLFWKAFFKSWSDFAECLRFWLTPNIISMFRGEYWEDRHAEFKLLWFVLTCAAAPLAEWGLLMKFVFS